MSGGAGPSNSEATPRASFLAEEAAVALTALAFLTRVPVPSRAYAPGRLRVCARWFPWVGWAVGAAGAGAFWAAARVWPRDLAVLISMVATILLTGAFHEDGWADYCDGFGGGWGKERILAIMRDSRLGAFGAIGIGCMLMAKFLCLRALPAHRLPAILWAAHALSRFSAVVYLKTLPYAGDPEGSKAKPVATALSPAGLAWAAAGGLLPWACLAGTPRLRTAALLAPVPLLLVHLGLGAQWRRRIGGYTGDCLGAAQQLTEAAFYLCLLAGRGSSG